MGRRRFRKEPQKARFEARINRQIRVRVVRVVDDEGNQLGVMDIDEAIRLAREKELDLVEVAAKADPPVCRIMDYGRYKFQKAKRERGSGSTSKATQVKEVKLRPKTDQHDYDFKLRNARRFLEAGHKTKITLMFRGREMAHTDWGKRKLDKFVEDCLDIAKLEVPPKLEGRNMSLLLIPKAQPPVKKERRPPAEREAPKKTGADESPAAGNEEA